LLFNAKKVLYCQLWLVILGYWVILQIGCLVSASLQRQWIAIAAVLLVLLYAAKRTKVHSKVCEIWYRGNYGCSLSIKCLLHNFVQ
jgi:uncharacterized membrane protein